MLIRIIPREGKVAPKTEQLEKKMLILIKQLSVRLYIKDGCSHHDVNA